MEKYQREEGPTFEQLRDEKGKTAEQMIEGATSGTSDTVNLVTGLGTLE